MKNKIAKSFITTLFITFVLTIVNTNTFGTLPFFFIWIRSWCIAGTIASFFNVFIFSKTNTYLKNVFSYFNK
ncbi:hypothetical protein ABF179_000026 [Flavobacterium psychrophilum]|uniref:hypothetical protein n=1 Tax=Flavobacterium psychrophilum TaxID=96345 RepID=UPI0010693B90|nr:hypothetical protein [Flavobacterium psychrophilum]ELI6454260.1 hypothetical protein [Flavobacterium psychrophilum]